jgi:hypothetical protein
VVLYLLRELAVLAALDGHDLLAPDVALVVSLPHHLAPGALPAAVIDPDRHPRPHQLGEQQCEGQADRAAAADGDPQDGRGVNRVGVPALAQRDGHVRLHVRRVEAEPLARDHDLVAGPETVGGNGGTVHPGPVAAAPVDEDIAVGFLPKLRVQPGHRGIGDDDVVVLAAAEGDRAAVDHEALTCQVTLQPPHVRLHRAISRSARSTA